MSTNALTELFEDALEKEEYALDLYTQIKGKIKDKAVIAILNKIIIDEKKHAENVKKILKLAN